MDDRVPVLILAGWLGAGKTTVLNRLLSDNTDGVRTAVLVNDVADVNVDGSLIVSHDGTVIELSNGCVCCSIGGSLALALRDMMASDPRPSRIVIEASGIAEPAKVAEYGDRRVLEEPTIMTVVDPFSVRGLLNDPGYRDMVTAQIRQADVVKYSRRDLVDELGVEAFEAGVRAVESVASAPRDVASSDADIERPQVEVSLIEGVVALDEVLQHLDSAEGLVRAKGIVDTCEGPVLVQWAGGRVNTSRAPGSPITGLVVLTSGAGVVESA
ncbi:MAG: GTP-binding protein [Actinomycetia bacterium]|nr:GTP-binding protein [Actinomycetes bacterium]MCP4960083.1 GTP-binding protein [Actinomycetes bacterium]